MTTKRRVSARLQKRVQQPETPGQQHMLPPELLNQVLQDISDHETLDTFSRTCKAFRAAALPLLFESLEFLHRDYGWLEYGAKEVSDAALAHVTKISSYLGNRTFHSPYVDLEYDPEKEERTDTYGRQLLSRLAHVQHICLGINLGGLNGRMINTRVLTLWPNEVGMFEDLQPVASPQGLAATISMFGTEGLNMRTFDWIQTLAPFPAIGQATVQLTMDGSMLAVLPAKRIRPDMGPVTAIELDIEVQNGTHLSRIPYFPGISSLAVTAEDVRFSAIADILREHASGIRILDIEHCAEITLDAMDNGYPVEMPDLQTLHIAIDENRTPVILRAIRAINLTSIDLGDIDPTRLAWLIRCWDIIFPVKDFPRLERIQIRFLQYTAERHDVDLSELEASIEALRNTLAGRKQELDVKWEVVVDSGCTWEEPTDPSTLALDRFQERLAEQSWCERVVGLDLHLNEDYADHDIVKQATQIHMPALVTLQLHICDDLDVRQLMDSLFTNLDAPALETVVASIPDGPQFIANLTNLGRLVKDRPTITEVNIETIVEPDGYDKNDDNVEALQDFCEEMTDAGLICSAKVKRVPRI